MKLSISLPNEDVEFLDEYARERGLESRSSALQKAVRLLRTSDLAASYESAWDEWDSAGEGQDWDRASADGLSG